MRLPQAMGSWPLAQSLFYQYKCTIRSAGCVAGQSIWSQPADAERRGLTQQQGRQIQRQCINGPCSCAAASGLHLGPTGVTSPRHRSRGRVAMPAITHHSGPSAQGGGWPLQATAQPWHAEARPSLPQW